MATKKDNQKTLDHYKKKYEHCSNTLAEALSYSIGGLIDVGKLDSTWKDYRRAYNGYGQYLFKDFAVNVGILVGIVRGHSRYINDYATARVTLEHQDSSAENVFVKMVSTGLLNPKIKESDYRSRLKTLFESDPEPVQQIRFSLEVVGRSVREASSFQICLEDEMQQDLVDLVRVLRVAENDLRLMSEPSIEITRKKEECAKLVDEKWKLCSILPRYLSSRTYYKFFKSAMKFEAGEPERNLARLRNSYQSLKWRW